jgi:hypothetical protein
VLAVDHRPRTSPPEHGRVLVRVGRGLGPAGAQSLVLVASPRRLSSDARLVNGPAWYPPARTRNLGSISIGGRRMREVWVPAVGIELAAPGETLLLLEARAWSSRSRQQTRASRPVPTS